MIILIFNFTKIADIFCCIILLLRAEEAVATLLLACKKGIGVGTGQLGVGSFYHQSIQEEVEFQG
jgi:hypothetical protein